MTNKQITETYTHALKGIEVKVYINYKEGYISLVDNNPPQGKNWLFAKRGIEYMQGWQDVLDAMKSAIADARKKLKAYQDEEEAEKLKIMERISKELIWNQKPQREL